MDYQRLLNEIYAEMSALQFDGKVASYIPELSGICPDKFGMHLCALDGSEFAVGDSTERFSTQSISKVLSLSLAFVCEGDAIWRRVDVEPSGNPFNSLMQLEYEHGIPRNPFINAGALVVADILLTHYSDPTAQLLSFARKLSGSPKLGINRQVAASEKAYGFRNAALVNLMKSFGNIENDVDAVLNFYSDMCAIEMNCRDLAQSFLLFANKGCLVSSGEQIMSASYTKRLNALMLSCGFYDEAGEFSFRVGLPGKSGVGGGIAAVQPGSFSVAVWSPGLNPHGNSAAGMKALESLTTKTGQSIF